MKKGISILSIVALATVAIFAAVIFDPVTGTGFVGKGDVQLIYGWNNKQLQTNAGDVQFQYVASSVVVTERSWICTNSNNQNTQERERTTTTTNSTTGLVETVARERNQITGFLLSGWDGTPVVVSSSVSDGNQLNSCPSGPWSLTTPAGDPEIISDETSGGLEVRVGAGAWQPIG